jgi:UDPglucose 6-dehydrogenase
MHDALTVTRPSNRRSARTFRGAGTAGVAVIGAGYVGLATALTLGAWGRRVRCYERDPERVRLLAEGGCPVDEPRVPEMLREHLREGVLSFDSEIDVRDARLVFLCVGTPADETGATYLDDLFDAVNAVGRTMQPGTTVVVKSTVPVGTSDEIEQRLAKFLPQSEYSVLANPEFLRQGRIIDDTERPDRIVIGALTREEAEVLVRLYRPTGAPIRVCDRRTAELTKYAANAFLATKISFINEIALLAETFGADVVEVAEAVGLDPRIGRDFLSAGIGYGGSCLPKDISSIRQAARRAACLTPLLDAVSAVNDDQPRRLVAAIGEALNGLSGKRVAVLGLTFKAHTSDCRASVAVEVVKLLEDAGAGVSVFDPTMLKGTLHFSNGAHPSPDAYTACAGAHAVVIATEWPEFAKLDWRRVARTMAAPFVFDGRNLCSPELIRQSGLVYRGIGRPRSAPSRG